MKVVVTGHTGFIGKHLIDCLKDLDIVGISRSASQAKTTKSIGLDLAHADHTDIERCSRCLSEVDAVVHLSGYRPVVRSARLDSFDENMKANVVGTLNALLLARMLGAARFVLASTKSVYKKSKTPISETGVTEPTTNYGRSKLLAERLSEACAESSEVSCIALRIASVFGSGMSCGLVFADFLTRALHGETIEVQRHSTGFERLDLIYVKDVVAAIRRALFVEERARFDVMNVGAKDKVGTYELATTIAQVTGSKSKIMIVNTSETRPSVRLDVEKASKVLGWVSFYDLRSAIEDLLPTWHCEQP